MTPQEIQNAMFDAIQSRLDDHPGEWVKLVYEEVVRNILAYTEGETRQVRDIRKRYVPNLQRVHVQPERVNFVHLDQGDLAAMGPNRNSSVYCARPPPLKTVMQARLRATLAVRTVVAAKTQHRSTRAN